MIVYSVAQAAPLIGKSKPTIYKLVKMGVIKTSAENHLGNPQFTAADIDEAKRAIVEYKRGDLLRRSERLAARYTSEEAPTMARIGADEGLTRERVRQILALSGVNASHSGRRKRAVSRSAEQEAAKVARQDARCFESYGCDWPTVANLTGAMRYPGVRHHPLLKAWWHHKTTAQRQYAEWQISLPQYAELVGPHLEKISRTKDGLVLSRKDKAGPFSVDNCQILTLSENSRRTNGFANAHERQKEKHEQAIRKCIELRASGLSNAEIAKVIRRSIATVAANFAIAKNLGMA